MNFAIALLIAIFTRIWWVIAFILAFTLLFASLAFAIVAAIMAFPARIVSWIGGCVYALGAGLGNMTAYQIQQRVLKQKQK